MIVTNNGVIMNLNVLRYECITKYIFWKKTPAYKQACFAKFQLLIFELIRVCLYRVAIDEDL